jgi:outer membrane protein OmpA-like peptidoglycan-associated protein
MALAFGIALCLNWVKPYWAGLAVAVCSLGRVGDSLNKGLLRAFGTFFAPKAEKLLNDMAALNECSRVVSFDAFYNNPAWGQGVLFVVDSTVEAETVTERKVVRVEVKDINFAFDQVAIQPGDYNNLKQVAEFLQNEPQAYAVLAGFTDSRGDPEYNLKLSRIRPRSAKNHILEQSRIDPNQVVLLWYGATNFIAENDTPEGRAKNRRVEVAIGMLE